MPPLPPPSSLPPPAFGNTSIRCLCGRNVDSAGEAMVQCCGPGCGVWQHERCVLPAESLLPPRQPPRGGGADGRAAAAATAAAPWRVPSRLWRSFLCEACRLADADPCWAPAADLARGSGNQNNWGRISSNGGTGDGSNGTASAAAAAPVSASSSTEPPARAGLVCPPVFLRRGPATLQAAQFPGAKQGDGPAAAEVRFSLSADAKKALTESAAKAAAAAAASSASAPAAPPTLPGTVELHVSSALLGDEVPSRCHWPRQAELRVNGLQHSPLYSRAASAKLGAGARDAPASVGRLARAGPGNRVLLATACECPTRSFALLVRLVKRRSEREIEALVGAAESPEEALSRVKRAMGGGGGGGGRGGRKRKRAEGGDSDDDEDDDDGGDDGGDGGGASKKGDKAGDGDDSSDDECLVVGTSTVSLRCPLTGARLRDPARLDDSSGGPSSAFELSAFVALGTKTRKWVCPHNPTKPAPLRRVRRDGFLAAVLTSLDSSGRRADREVTEIEVDVATGEWRPSGRGDREPWRSILARPGGVAAGGRGGGGGAPPPPPPPLENGSRPATRENAAAATGAGTAAGGAGEAVVVKAERWPEQETAAAAAAAAPPAAAVPAAAPPPAAPAVPPPQEDDIIVLSSSDDDGDLSAPIAVGGGVAGRAPPPAAGLSFAQQQQRGLHVRLPPRPVQPLPDTSHDAAAHAAASAYLFGAGTAGARGAGEGPSFVPPPQLFARRATAVAAQQHAQRALAALQAASAVPLPPNPPAAPLPLSPPQQQQLRSGGSPSPSLLAARDLPPERLDTAELMHRSASLNGGGAAAGPQ